MSTTASPLGALVHLIAFTRLLRSLGLPVGTHRALSFCQAVAELAPTEPTAVYWAGRVTLVARPDHIDVYDRAFRDYFGGTAFNDNIGQLLAEALKRDRQTQPLIRHATRERIPTDKMQPDREEIIGVTAAETEALRHRRFEDLTDHERTVTDRMTRALAIRLPRRISRRYRSARRSERLDLRRTLRHSFRTEGEPLARKWKTRRDRSRPLILLLDVSGSMSEYSRALLQFAYAAMATDRNVEVFCFGTRLTRVSGALRTRDPNRGLAEVSATVQDWSGGTRIGASLKHLLDHYAQTAVLRGATLIVCSDGLDRGHPERLGAQMARLSRLAYQIVWVNPLKGDPGYEPLARGMAAALPYVDVFLPGHNVASLEKLVEVVSHPRRPPNHGRALTGFGH